MRANATKRGFTLIELLVVIAVIAILASILFPVFTKAVNKAKQTTCLSNVRQLTTAMIMLVQDNKNVYPTVSNSDLTQTWAAQLESYAGNRKLFRCPLDDNGDGYVSYVMNGLLFNYDGTGIQSSALKNPSEVGLFADGTSYKFPEAGVLNWTGDAAAHKPATASATVERHSLCVSYTDGHAEALSGAKNLDTTSFFSPMGTSFYQANMFGYVNNYGAGVVAPGAGFNAANDAAAVEVHGSTTAIPLWSAAAAAWNAAGGNVTLACTGSGDWAAGDLGASDAPADNAAPATVIATDAYGICVASDSRLNVKNLTTAQITAIIQGQNAAGSNPITGTVHFYSRKASSGTRKAIEAVAGAENLAAGGFAGIADTSVGLTSTINSSETVTVVASAQEMASKVAADPYGIGYVSVGDGIDPIKLQIVNYAGVKFDRSTVADGTYGLTRKVVAKVNVAGNTAAADFLAYVRNASTFRKSLIFSTGFFLQTGD